MQGDARERIIEAAYQVLAAQGYDAASNKEIARRAGVALGLVGYYFPAKDQLFVEVFRKESERYCEALTALLGRKAAGESITLAEALQLPMNRASENPEWIRLRYELFSLGMRNRNVEPLLSESLARKREHLADLSQRLFDVDPTRARELAPILVAVFDGLALQKMANPDFDLQQAYQTLAGLFSNE